MFFTVWSLFISYIHAYVKLSTPFISLPDDLWIEPWWLKIICLV